MTSDESALLAEQCAKFAAGIKDGFPRGVFTLDFVPETNCLVVYNTIPYPSDLAGLHPGKDGEAYWVIDRLKAQGVQYLGGIEYPDPGDRVDKVSYALLFSIGGVDKRTLTQLVLEEIDRGTIERPASRASVQNPPTNP